MIEVEHWSEMKPGLAAHFGLIRRIIHLFWKQDSVWVI